MGVTLHIPQGEGGEQGDPLMPILFAFVNTERQKPRKRGWVRGQHVMAFLDDIHTASKQDFLVDVHTAVDEELLTNAQIRLHHGKDASMDEEVWSRTGCLS